jgi:hypothetical protein
MRARGSPNKTHDFTLPCRRRQPKLGIVRRFWGLWVVAVVTTLVCTRQPYDRRRTLPYDEITAEVYHDNVLGRDMLLAKRP